MLKVRNLRSGYHGLEVIKGVSLHVNSGEIVTLIGANGAGKSTLLKTLAGLLQPWSGEIELGGNALPRLDPWQGVERHLVLVPEGRQLFADMSVMDNLMVGGYRNPDRRRIIEKIFERFPRLRERSRQSAGTLSGGEQQMLAIGRALIARPRLLLLDEPSIGLAPLMVREVMMIIRELRERGVTIFLVEQNAMAALQIADRAYVLETGEIVAEGSANNLRNNSEVQRAYMGKGYKEVWE